jgi:nucleoside-diphosphate-sugar epimerase
MRSLVTGGAGFIGSHLVDALVSAGHEVVVVDDLSTGNAANLPAGARLVVGSVADEGLIRDAIAGCELVFHQAAHKAVLRSVEHPLTTDLANTHGTLTVLQAAREAGVRRFVHASSSSVYGGAAPVPTPESAALLPKSPYAVSKLAAEHYCRVFHELYGLETVALRYFNVYGPRMDMTGAYTEVLIRWMTAIAAGQAPVIFGDGMQTMDFVHVKDIARANLLAAIAPTTDQVFNVASGTETSLNMLLDMLLQVMGSTLAPEHAPARKVNPVPRRLASTSAAREQLGFEASITLEEGLQSLVAWWQAERCQEIGA